MRYPNVKNAHVVPKSHLRLWEVDGTLAVRLVDDPAGPLLLPADSVGTRRRAYRRIRPNGDPIDDGEWMLSQLESAATPLLSQIPDLWPLDRETKAKLAQLFAFQIVRGPRWMSWHDERFVEYITESAEKSGTLTVKERAKIEAFSAQPESTNLITVMIQVGYMLSTIVGSMHWSLLEFRRPFVATSDHPVFLWRADQRSLMPVERPVDMRDIGAREIRIPVSPTLAILATWCDDPDDEAPRVTCTRDHAANLNAFTVAQAEKQWFHQPGITPPRASGRLLPLAAELLPGRDTYPRRPIRRRALAEHVVSMRGPLRKGDPVTMFFVTGTE